MMSPFSLLRLSSVLMLLLPHFARAQDLADVLSSIQERKRAVEQAAQMDAHLPSLGGVNHAIPDQQLIKWEGLTGVDFPAAGSFASKGIEEQVALLNQAILEFRKLSDNYMNLRPEDLTADAKIGAIRPYLKEDFPELGRADASNYHALVSELAQDVMRLRVLPWPFAGKKRTMDYTIHKWERLEVDESGHDTIIEEYAEGSQTCSGWAPTSLGGGSVDTGDDGSWSISGFYAFAAALTEDVSVSAGFRSVFHSNESEPQNSYTLRTLYFNKSAAYHSEAALFAAVPGRTNDQLGGKVALLARNSWSPATAGAVTAPETWNHADATHWVVKAETDSTAPTSLGAGPVITVNVAWFDSAGSIPEDLSKMALLAGFDEMQSNYAGTYIEGSWQNQLYTNYNARILERKLYAFCVPDFKKGLNSGAKAASLAQSALKFRPTSGDAAPLLHPVPGLLAGVPLGVGIEGNSPGWIGISPGDFEFHGVDADFGRSYASSGIIYPDAIHNKPRVIRFDYASNLRFVGSAQDFHVVYATERSLAKRGADLPALAPTSSEYAASGWLNKFFTAWDMPRLRQVVSRDFLVDITPQGHFKNEVKIYRRPLSAGAVNRTPGHLETPDSAQLVRTLVFSNPDAPTTAYPVATAPEKVHIADGTTVYEVWKDALDTWYPVKIHPLHFKITKGTTECFSKVIEFPDGLAAKITTKVDGITVSVDEITDTGRVSAPWRWWDDQSPESVVRNAGTKTTTIINTITHERDDLSAGSQEGRYPDATTINHPDLPQLSLEWKASGVIDTISQGLWSTAVTNEGGVLKVDTKLGDSLVGTVWTEWSESGRKVKTYSAPDGTAGSKSAASVAWSETEYGDTSGTGLPGLPHSVKNSDGTGTNYQWTAGANGAYGLTQEQGLLTGNTVSRGTKVNSDINASGQPNKIEFFATSGGILKTAGTTFSNFNDRGMPRTGTDFNTGLAATWDFDGIHSRLASHTSPLGVGSSFLNYDLLGRPATVSRNGISAAMTYNAFSQSATLSGGGSGSTAETRDTLGRLTSSSVTWNGVTQSANFTHASESVGISQSHSLLGTFQTSLRPQEGTVASASGPTLAFGGTQGTALTVEGGLLKSTTQLTGQAATFLTTWSDAWGRIRKSTAPSLSGSGTTTYLYSDAASTLKRVAVTDPTGRKTLTESDPHNPAGAITRSGIDVNGNGILGATDRYVETSTSVSGGNLVTTLHLTEDSGLREILRSQWTPSSNQTVTKINGNEETLTRTPNYTTKTITTTSSKGWSKTETFNNLGLTTSSALTGAGLPTASLTPTWRADGSLSGVTFTSGGNTHSATFNPDGSLATLNAPGRGNILGSHSISGGSETLTVDGVTTVTKLDGTQTTTSGSDVIGKTDTLAINGSGFRETTHPATGAATTLELHASGAATAKNYAAGNGESYIYASGLLSKITLARSGQLSLGYSPDGAKDLTSATWPALASGVFSFPTTTQTYGYDRAGRMNSIGDASGLRATIHQNGRPAATVWNSGALAGYKIVRNLDTSGRDTGFSLFRANVPIHSAVKVSNGLSGEISGISADAFSATFTRNPARNVTAITRGPVTQTWTRDLGGRITAATSNVAGAPAFTYPTVDAKGRRLTSATTGGTWTYQYTAGQLTSAIHPTLGSFSYQFDGIGRRTDKGSANTADLLNRTLAWTHNQNKTLQITAAPAANIWIGIGTAAPTQIPNFTGSFTYPIPSPGPAGGWVAWNTLAVLTGQGDPGANPDAKAEQSGATWVPPISESFTYDAAGNRQSTARWDLGWDGKNQLTRARTRNNALAPQGYDITHAYDAEGRRFSQKISRYQGGDVAEQKFITYLHAGNDLIYERHQLPSGLTLLERKYLWGPDLSGTQGGAGGAGGLLLIRETKGTTTTDLYPLYDGSGNVTALADTTGALQAEYAYGPFGETIYARGPKAASCPFRFATKYYDQETGFYNFGKRFYDPVTGQFLSREPLGEKESLNLYSYCGNDPINYVDVLGLAPKWMTEAQGKVYDDMVREAIQSGNFSSNLSSDILRAMAADGILPDSSAAEDERLGIYYGTVGKVALNHPNFVSTAGILSSAVVGIIKTIPGNGPEGGGAADGSNSTGALVFDTFRLNANSLVALGNPGSSSVQNGFSEFHEGYNKKYSYEQRSFAQGASLAASILMPTAIAQSKAALASSPGWSTKLAPRLNPLNYRVAAGELYSGVPRLQFTGVKGAQGVGEDIYVIGRQIDTAAAKDWAGHKILDIPDWTLKKNDAWTQGIIDSRAKVYIGTPQNPNTLWDAVNNRPTVFARELNQLLGGGYKQVGDYMYPPRY